jgi:hypothetical protein
MGKPSMWVASRLRDEIAPGEFSEKLRSCSARDWRRPDPERDQLRMKLAVGTTMPNRSEIPARLAA